jgi:hypothetical protein
MAADAPALIAKSVRDGCLGIARREEGFEIDGDPGW